MLRLSGEISCKVNPSEVFLYGDKSEIKLSWTPVNDREARLSDDAHNKRM